MNSEEFNEIIEGMWISLGDPNRESGMFREIDIALGMSFIDGDTDNTIDQMTNELNEMRRELNRIQNALDLAVENWREDGGK